MSWGAYVQQGLDNELDLLGSKLSIEIGCPVHYPAYNKRLFECRCGVIFPYYLVDGGNWEGIKRKHEEERKLCRES